MSASLVGSEMCIRDRLLGALGSSPGAPSLAMGLRRASSGRASASGLRRTADGCGSPGLPC
eukprot:1375855-Alexandrium_andersonii.AAC.1